jgi:dipeptidyl aminopeptidase/acylaminoacyl peptidase
MLRVRHRVALAFLALVVLAGVWGEFAVAVVPGENGLVAVSDAKGISTVDPATGARRVLIPLPSGVEYLYYPAWSPSGEEIAYAECERSGLCGTGIIARSDGSPSRTFADSSRSIWRPSWSPDGSSIAYSSFDPSEPPYGATIRLFTLSSGRDTALTALRRRIDDSPTWSPDAQRICFSRARQPDRPSHLYLTSADGGPVRRLTRGGSPDWSPNGKQIAFVDKNTIFVISPSGQGRRRITTGTEPAWSPDGAQLLYSYQHAVWVINLKNGTSRRLADNAASASWQPVPVQTS